MKILNLYSTVKYSIFSWLAIAVIICCIISCGKSGTETPVTTNPIPTPVPSGNGKSDVAFWLTNPDQQVLFKKQTDALNFSSSSNANPSIVVDTTQIYQSIDGFGAALTGGSAYLINQLSTTDRKALLQELFSSDSTFIGMSYLRISVGASDLDATVFSYDDMPSGQTDAGLQRFSIAPDNTYLIPVLKDIIALNPKIKILGSPWSAPAWMKTNESPKGGSLKPEYYSEYANYFVKYIKAMEGQGIKIDAITPQNEPLNPNNNPSMSMSATEENNFVRNFLGPAFQTANIATKIIVYDHNCDVPSYPLTILNDPATKKFVDGSAFHLYAGDISALYQVHITHPDRNIYFTEQWVGGPQNFAGDLKWHVKNLIIGATKNWSKNVLEWNLASDPNYYPHTSGGCSTCLGAVTIGTSVLRNVSYYIIAHASKFVKSGSVRIESTNIVNLPNVAFKTPEGKKVLIVLNESASTLKFNIQFKDMIVSPSISGGAVGTYVW
ncbi:MAG: glycoside hydrolase family 30 beta sandwich domain-containing protein [Prolixibacteraceae bacterium]